MAILDSDATLYCRKCGSKGAQRVKVDERKHVLIFPCGHSRIQNFLASGEVKFEAAKAMKAKNPDDWKSLDGKMELYPYQQEGVKFLESCGGNALLADDMGLGKTPQFLGFLRRHMGDLTPTLILVKSATITQWGKQFQRWTDNIPMRFMPIFNAQHIIPGFKVYIMSHDLLGRKGVLEKLKKCGIKCLCVDESQCFKDPDSLRTKALIKLIEENQITKRVFLSGTPIKNRAGEYFTILNLIDPNRFSSRAHFRNVWLDGERLNPGRMEEFRRVTSHYIIRRMRDEIEMDLPELSLNSQLCNIEDADMGIKYNSTLDLFANWLNSPESAGSNNNMEILAWLTKLRRITGMAKLTAAQAWINEFRENNPGKKLIVGIHHESLRDALYYANRDIALKLSGENSGMEKGQIVQQFIKDPKKELLILNMLAGGTGVDGLQDVCSDILQLECLWGPTDVDQFYARLHRNGQANKVTATKLLAAGTIDQWFEELNESKEAIIGETVDGWDITSDPQALRSFAEMISTRKI